MTSSMTTRKQAVDFCMKFKDTYEDYPFHDANWTCMRIKTNKRIFAWIYERNDHIWVNVKCDPEWRDFWRNAYESVLPAYHTIPDQEIQRMIGDSYELCIGKKKKSPRKDKIN